MMTAYAYFVLAAGWLVWVAPFFMAGRHRQMPQQVDRRARWGILIVAVAYFLLWPNNFWARPLPLWRIVVSVILLFLAAVFSWAGTLALGRQWRLDAGLNPDHELVTGGAYNFVRHPIYTSMLFLLLGTGFMVTPLPMLLLSVAVFIVGTEIRVRIEDRLLAARFGDQFLDYQRKVPAYIPFTKWTLKP